MDDQRFSDNDVSKRDIPSFIEPLPPLIQNPFMRPRPHKGIKLFEEEELEEPELVQVYLRLKPCKLANNLYEIRSDRSLVTSLDTTTAGHGRRTQHNVTKMYTFTKIFPAESRQKEIFEVVVKDNLKKLPEGHNFTLLTYGPSGSGKTYTLMGTVGEPGLVPRSLEYVFQLVEAAQHPIYKPAENGADKLSYAEQDYELQWVRKLCQVSVPFRDRYRRMSVQLQNELTSSTFNLSNRTQYYVWVSFVEIYNEGVYDLLAPPEKRTKLRIREDSNGHVYVKGAAQAFVRSGEQAYDVMAAGKHNLRVAATGVHAHSSRSHCIFTITMLTETDGEIRPSVIRLCDLAGCERAQATRNTGARMQESRAINSSLHVLERCLHMLRRNQQRHKQDNIVPYRESKLTRLLGSGLSGARGEAVSMVVTLNPSPEYANETKHVLTLAAVAQDIQINNTVASISSMDTFNSVDNTTIESGTEYMKLKCDNERLHFELMQAQVRNRDLILMMETKQRENADIMNELVDKAKKNVTQFYEMQLDALQSQMDDLKEEYEEKIAELEEELIAEKLARARVEKEIQHLRTCIEERDEKYSKEDVVTISDYENESDKEVDDPLNQSLEPVLKRDIINRSKAFDNTKEIIQDNEDDSSDDELFTNKSCQNQKEFDSCENSVDKFEFQSCISDTDKDHNERVKTINSKQREADDTMNQLTFDTDRKISNVFENSTNESNLIKSIKSINNETTTNEFSQLTFDDDKVINNITNDKNPFNIKDTGTSLLFESRPNAKANVMTDFTKFTYDDKKKFDTLSNDDNKVTSNVENNKEIIKNIGDGSYSKTNDQFTELTFDDEQLIKDFSKKTQILEPKFIKELKPLNTNSDVDVIKDIFSKLTSEDEFSNDLPKPTVKSNSCDDKINVIQPKTSRGTYFVRECINSPSKNVNEFPSVLATRGNILIPNTENRSPKHTFDHKKYDMRKIKPDIVKTMVESFESIQEKVINVDSPCKKPTESMIVSKIVQSIKSNQCIDNSLLQFENLEIATREFKSPDKKIGFGDIKILQDKRNLFVLEKENSKEKESESDKTGINAALRSPVLGSSVAEIKAPDNIKLYESDTIINKKSNKEVIIKSPSSQEIVNDKKGGRQQPYFDLKLDDSKTTSSVNIVTSTLSSKNNLQQIINNVNSSIDDMNSFKDKRCFGKEDNPVEKITKTLLCDNINDENIIKDNVKSNMNNNRIENDIEKNTCNEKNDHEELLPVTIKKRVFFDDISQKIVKKEPEKDLKPLVKVEYDPKFVLKNKHNSIDIFDELSPFSNKRGLDHKKEADDSNINKIEINENKNICNVNKDVTNKIDSFTDEVKLNDNMQVNDTIRVFEDIYADISVARVTDFDLLVTDTNSNGPSTSSRSNSIDKKVTDIDKLNEEITPNSYNNEVSLRENDQCSKIINEKHRNNTEDKDGGTASVENVIKNTNKAEDIQDNLAESIAEIHLETNTKVPKEVENEKHAEEGKYNLRRKAFARSKAEPLKLEDVMTLSKSFKEEFSTECSTNCEKPRRPNLRLRRHKNQDSEDMDTKLKDIVNLQTEFCDVTLDKPTTQRKVKDIPSPENESENLSPYDIQSCPSKRVTRSRRKLFTPRAEALDEGEDQTGESNERIRVPRPSYHKPRARRKL